MATCTVWWHITPQIPALYGGILHTTTRCVVWWHLTHDNVPKFAKFSSWDRNPVPHCDRMKVLLVVNCLLYSSLYLLRFSQKWINIHWYLKRELSPCRLLLNHYQTENRTRLLVCNRLFRALLRWINKTLFFYVLCILFGIRHALCFVIQTEMILKDQMVSAILCLTVFIFSGSRMASFLEYWNCVFYISGLDMKMSVC